ncbi:GTP-binding protein [Lysobacteraceae bacterium NML75-0749]|nr:GTP-binding protein [Xanthomonadaceae bacterium NML03-0222]PJK02182.1 GTP-binding protein [Xanthomonadaceae bacterium NML75-0749]PJK02626.1 GTP-binding protein [Xanthomonadaceae bacterium NML91-0268]PJK03056.1 GTP-binding protein [Xanthomonadaceae bacterium NML71-0210]
MIPYRPSFKIAFIGPPGVGKTTCIRALSDIAPVDTDVASTDDLIYMKPTTTVAFDYGEMDLRDDGRLLLYGLPGQARFSYMYSIVREGLLGTIVLVDAAAPDGLEGFRETLDAYAVELRKAPCVVAVNKDSPTLKNTLLECQRLMRTYRLTVPLLHVDIRQMTDMGLLFHLLFTQLQYGFEQDTLATRI